ncbi:MAG: proline dehydrogenase family protein [Gemmatimonadota bacterium]
MLIWPATRFVAGEAVGPALDAVRELNQRGISASLDLLGENVSERSAADAAGAAYVGLLRAIAEAGADANISIKLTMLGLDIAPELAGDHLVTILDAAAETGTFVRIDMEGSPYTQLTLELFHQVFPTRRNVGVVIQSMLRRSAADVERLIGVGARVRLVKGAYQEPPPLAFPEKDAVNASYDQLAERLLAAGTYPAIATHDDARIERAIRFAAAQGIASDGFEFQMLYGIRRDTQVALVERGYRMRVYVPYGGQWLPYFTRRLRERKENVGFVLRNLFRG